MNLIMFGEDDERMVFSPIASSHLRGVNYESSTQILLVRFDDGSVYQYSNVPADLFQQMLDAQPHPWSAVGRELMKKGKYDGTRIS